MCTTMKQLEKTVSDYRSMEAMKAQIEKEMEALKNDIFEYLDKNEKTSEIGKDFTVKVSICERKTLDSKRLEADLGSLAEYQKVTEYRRLYVR